MKQKETRDVEGDRGEEGKRSSQGGGEAGR
jgi:hypothetical protein